MANGKVYVGQTFDFAQRKSQHIYESHREKANRPLYRSMRKNGIENFVFDILEECEDSLSDERERYWISYYDSHNPEKGYNLTQGGEFGCLGYLHSEETKKKIGEATSKRQRGSDNWIFGKDHPKEVRDRITEKMKRSMSTAEYKKKTSSLFSGEKNPMFGRTGDKSPHSKLNAEQKQDVLSLIRDGKSDREIALLFDVSRFTIMRIRKSGIL